MRITLVHPAGFNFVPGQPDFSVLANRMPPIGIMQLASWLEKFGHEVQLHDCLGPYGTPTKPRENIFFKAGGSFYLLGRYNGTSPLFQPLTADHFKAVSCTFNTCCLLGLALLAGVNSISQQLAGGVAFCTSILEADIGINTHRQCFVLTREAVIKSPPLRPISIEEQIQTPAIG